MANPIIQARVPADVRDEANQVLEQMGLTMSAVMRMVATRIAQDKRLPFELVPNQTTEAAFRELDEQRGGHRATSVQGLMDQLDADD